VRALIEQLEARAPLPPASFADLLEAGPYIRQLIAEHPNLPATCFPRLARDPELEVREALARHPRTPPELLSELAQDEALAPVLLEHPKLPDTLVLRLAARAPEALCRRPLSAKLALRLAREGGVLLRFYLAQHPNLPLEALQLLAQDPAALVRGEIARRKELPHEPKTALQRDPSPYVRQALP